MSTPRSAALEQMFERVERESEQRAKQAELRAATASSHQLRPAASSPLLSGPSRKRERKRTSISISRVGQVEEPSDTTSYFPTSKLSSLPLSSSLYGQPPVPTRSVDSFGSDTETSPIEDQVTQMHHFGPRQSISKTVGGMLTRKLSRSRSNSNLRSLTSPNMMIGVSVEQATTESYHAGHKESSMPTSTVEAVFKNPQGRRSQASESGTGWVDRAKKGFTKKIKGDERRGVTGL